jgi:hypothetical protein
VLLFYRAIGGAHFFQGVFQNLDSAIGSVVLGLILSYYLDVDSLSIGLAARSLNLAALDEEHSICEWVIDGGNAGFARYQIS